MVSQGGWVLIGVGVGVGLAAGALLLSRRVSVDVPLQRAGAGPSVTQHRVVRDEDGLIEAVETVHGLGVGAGVPSGPQVGGDGVEVFVDE